MDLTWLILLAVIAAVSSVMSKRAEQQAKKKAEEAGEEPAKRRTTASTPRSPGPPVAPGPFGGGTRERSRPAPRPAQRTAPTRPPAPERQPDPSVKRADGREVFQRMRRQLEQRRREVDADYAPKHPRMPASDAPERAATADKVATAPVARETQTEPTPPPRAGESTTQRIVADAAVAEVRKRSRRFALNGDTLRRAVIMKEILDRPVALRDRVGGWDET